MRLLLPLTLSSLLFLNACSGLKTRDDMNNNNNLPQAEKYEPPPTVAEAKTKNVPIAQPKVGIILGPGGLKAIAHAGVLKELQKAKIPIDAIVGVEWGALVATLYAQNLQANEVEWKLFKLDKKDFPEENFFSGKRAPESISKLQDYFDTNINNLDFRALKIPTGCPSISIQSGAMAFQDRGSVQNALKKCMPYPPIFTPDSKNLWMASAFSLDDSIRYLKSKGAELIILVNVMGRGELFSNKELQDNYSPSLIWHELIRYYGQAATKGIEVIDVQTRNYKLFDLEGKNGLLMAGSQAGQQAASKLIDKYGF